MNTPPTVIASFFTLAGPCELALLGGTEISPHNILDRIRIAGEVGYQGFGFADRDLRFWAGEVGIDTIRRELESAGIDVVEIEALFNWWTTGTARAESDALREEMLGWAAALNARHIKVGTTLEQVELDYGHVASEFAALAADFDEVGALVGLEPMAVAAVKSTEVALSIVEESGATNAGIVIDTWHIVRGNIPFESLSTIDPTRIVTIELNDSAIEPVGGDLINDGANHRRFPGQGEQDLSKFVGAIQATGYAGPWGNENISTEARRMDLREAATVGYRAVVECVGS